MLKNLFAIATVFSFSLAAQKPADAGIAQLQRDLTGWMQQGDVPGVSIAVLRHAKTARIGSYGTANKATRQPVTDRTVFNAASLSKTIFAYTVLRLGQTELAVKNYEKVLSLNPNSRNAKAMLEKLRASGKP